MVNWPIATLAAKARVTEFGASMGGHFDTVTGFLVVF